MSIWQYKEIRQSIDLDESRLLSLEEGETQTETIKNGELKLILKREDLNPTGSWKDRGTAYKLTQLISNNEYEAVLSSSGNAAISFLTYANRLAPNFKLHVVISTKINPIKEKLITELVKDSKHEIHKVENTRKLSIEIAAQKKIPNLRSSIDDEIIKGYWSLGYELAQLLNQDDNNTNSAIFVPVSSGTALVGLVQGLFSKIGQEALMPKIIVCQTEAVHPIVNNEISKTKSLADAIIDTIALRSPQIRKIMSETNGEALSISNDELKKAKQFIDKDLSYTSLLSVAGFLRLEKDLTLKKAICIASGR